MRTRDRAQCLVVRGDAVLMVQTRDRERTFWCLPGGGIESGEAPDEAALRELHEECCVRGQILQETAVTTYSRDPEERHYTFWVDIGAQEPRLGCDPEFAPDAQCMVAVGWRRLADLSEKDRVFLWTAGLLTLPPFAAEVLGWPDAAAYPISDEYEGDTGR